MMKIIDLKKTKKQEVVNQTIKVLKDEGLVIYPTETCYGAGVDATNQKAVNKLLTYKRRREGKAISVAVSDQKMAEKYVILNETAKSLYQNFLPGPLTIVSQSKSKVAKGLEAEDQTLGIRIPDYPLILEIIKKFGKPITTTSANVAYKKTPYCLKDIVSNTTKKQQALIDLFLNAGDLPKNPPSTVVDTLLNEPQVLRQGEIKIPEKPGQVFISNSEFETQNIAAKILKQHATRNPLKARLTPGGTQHAIIFALQGELGSGKTQFAKGLGKALRIKENIVSPTFILVREYKFKPQQSNHLTIWPFSHSIFFHIDTWRMQEAKELWEIGFEKMLAPGNIIAIEWLQKVKPILEEIAKQKKAHVIWVEIEVLSPTKRKIKYKL